MISTFVPVSDSFVVAGTSDSQIQIVQFPSVESTSNISSDFIRRGLLKFSPRFSDFIRPLNTAILGKCSHSPVGEIAHLGEHVAAVSGNTLSTWDLVKNCRVRHLTTPDQSAACKYIGNKLLAVAGLGQSVHLYDTRVANKSSIPIWSTKLAKDNIYTLAVEGTTVLAAGADGSIYGVDLRAQHKIVWDLQPEKVVQYSDKKMDSGLMKQKLSGGDSSTNAILDLTVSNGCLVFTLESGHVCGVPLQFNRSKDSEFGRFEERLRSPNVSEKSENQIITKIPSLLSGGNFFFMAPFSSGPVGSRIGCDVLDVEGETHIAVGSESGHVRCYNYSRGSGNFSEYEKSVDMGEKNIVPCVRWSPRGLCMGVGTEVLISPFSGSTY